MAGAPLPANGPPGNLAHSNRLGTENILPPAVRPGAARAAIPTLETSLTLGYSFLSLCFRRRGLRGAPTIGTMSLLVIRRRRTAQRAPSADAGPL